MSMGYWKVGDVVIFQNKKYVLRLFQAGRLNCKPHCALYGNCKDLFGFACDNRLPDDEPFYFEATI